MCGHGHEFAWPTKPFPTLYTVYHLHFVLCSHRGAALGSLMGAALGEKGIPNRLVVGLHDHAAIKEEIDAFISTIYKS